MNLSLQTPQEFFRQQLRKHWPNPDSSLVIQSYLVQLLCHYLVTEELFRNRKNFYFFEEFIKQVPPQELGDKLLLLTGFYPGHLQQRLVSLDFYQALGARAYAQVYHHNGQEVFEELARHFRIYGQVLDRLRQESEIQTLVPAGVVIFNSTVQ